MSDSPNLAGPALALRLEQARRWRHGDRAPAEEYLARYPELSANPEYALEVVYGELLLREEEGEAPRVEEYLQRFPQFAPQVQRLFDVHRAVRSASLAQSGGTEIHRRDTVPEFGGTAVQARPSLPGYEIREELGRGGMGVVLVCRDNPLGRDLAIKVLRPEHRGDPVAEQRFLEEAQITGQLQHPGVVPVHQVGRLPDGRPYFTMKLVRGQTLADLLEARAEPGQDRSRFLTVFRQVCQTLAYAHDRGVVHRDLKPSNVMVGAFDEVQVMDWGLAKVLGGSGAAGAEPAGLAPADLSVIRTLRSEAPEMASRTGTVLGTPSYMAPEQARGEVGRVNERCDVFGLGAMLCEILTGRPPFDGETVEEVFRQAREADLGAARARLEGCGADEELVRLAQRCLAADAAARPRDAGEVARAVTAHLASVQERLRQAELERTAEQARAAEALAKARAERKARHRTVVAAVAALAVVVLGGGGGLWWRQRAEAVTQRIDLLLNEQVEPLTGEGRWPEALAVARQAEALLTTGGIPTELRRRVRERLSDAEMVVRLEDIRLSQAELKDGSLDRETPARDYSKAFRNYGIDVEGLETGEVVARIRQRSIRDHLTAALEDWALLLVAPTLKERLLAIAEEAGSEDWRSELRAARGTKDR
jgi:serine/threonine-protein kinase